MNYEEIARWWRERNPKTADELDTVLENFRILFAYHSNSIEGAPISYHDTREIFENGEVIGYTGELRTLFEVQNQKNCYELLKGPIVERRPITPELILEIHESLMHGCYDERRWNQGERPGEYKKHDYVTGDGIGSVAGDVATEIEALCKELEEAEHKDILTEAAYLHLRFETIHPFADGNGRVGRTLMNYYLMINDHPPLVIYQEDKRTYYMALAVYDNTEELTGFVEFMKEELEKTWRRRPPQRKLLREHLEGYDI